MRTLGNIIWIIFGGLIYSILWLFVGLLLCFTIVGIPAGAQCFKIAGFILAPFGRDIVYGNKLSSFILNLLWILIFGWELSLMAAMLGLLMCVTIIGIPFGLQYFKFARLSFMPFGSYVR